MGFYTALALSGALPLEDAIALVDTMGAYQKGNVIGGQVLYPFTRADWTVDAERRALIDRTLHGIEADGHRAEWSIDLGGYAVLGADRPGVKALLERLPADTRGKRTFPIQLPLHSAFHTSLMRGTSETAARELAGLRFRPPDHPLIDGRGFVFRPGWADPAALRDYTLGHQVHQPFDLTLALRTAFEFCAPDVVIALGPGNALGGPIARTLVASNWRGISTRAAFLERTQTDPLLLSTGVPEQRERLLQ
jgi:acyl transferase domain-containing protein